MLFLLLVLSALLANEEDLAREYIRIPDLSKLDLDTFKHTAQIIVPSDLTTTQGIVNYKM